MAESNQAAGLKIPKPMTAEERERRYAELRGRMQMSRIFVEPPAGIAVRWVRKDDPVDISTHKWMGFEHVVEDIALPALKEGERPGMPGRRRFRTAVPANADGTYTVGDVILMEIAEDDYEFYIQEGVNRSRSLVDAGKENFLSEAEKHDVPVFERDKAGNIKTGNNARVRR